MSNVTLIIAAAIAILAVAGLFLLLRKPTQRVSLSDSGPPPIAAPKPPAAPREGHGIADGAAAAVLDITGPVIGTTRMPICPPTI